MPTSRADILEIGYGHLTNSTGITAASTSMTVTVRTGAVPAVMPFLVTLDDGTDRYERVLVTAVAGSTWTITRAQEGTLAAAHGFAASISFGLTSQEIADLVGAQPNDTVVVEGPLLVSRYVDDLTGATDVTTDFQRFVTDLVVNGWSGYIPPGTELRISSKINFPMRPSWSLKGASRGSVTIKQYTNNTPIFDLGTDSASQINGWEISGITFTYANTQPAANTSANPILFSKMCYEGRLLDCNFYGGAYAMRVATGIGGPWGTTFDDLVFGSGLSRGAMDWTAAANSVPNNRFGRIFVDAINMVDTIFDVRGYNFIVDTIEIINTAEGAQLFQLAAGGMAEIGTLKLENGAYSATTNLLSFPTGCRVRIGHLFIGGGDLSISGGAIVNILSLGSGGSVGNLHIDHVRGQLTSLTGSAYVVSTTAPVVIGEVDLSGGWELQNNGSTTSGEKITVRDWVNGRLSANKGDADYTVTLGDPNIVSYQTTLTAQRTVTLPSTGDNLHNGLYYRLVFDGAINGANTVLVKAGATTLRTQSDDKRALTYTWRRHTTPASGWVLTGYETLP